MVRGKGRKGKEEDLQGTHLSHTAQETQNVKLYRVQGAAGDLLILLLAVFQVVYKRYASLFFCFAVDKSDNELNVLEVIHR